MEGPGLDVIAGEYDIMPMAIGTPTVTVKRADGSGEQTSVDDATALTWEHNKIYTLNVQANYNGVTGGQVKITIAPGLKITDYFKDTATIFSSVDASRTANVGDFPNYVFPTEYDTLLYTVEDTAAAVSLDVTLAVDTVLWPKTEAWSIENAIKVEFIEGGDTITKTASVTVNSAKDETTPSWNKLYVSDSNNSVPADANKPFRMKIYQIAPNLHGTPLGLYYKELKVTVPLPMTQGGATYASYARVDCTPNRTPAATEENPDDHTVTFTWQNLYVPAGGNFSFTPYFQWSTPQTANSTVVYADVVKFKAEATPCSGSSVIFDNNLGTTSFTVRGDVAVNINPGGGRQGETAIFNYGSLDQVYQLGQFQVRNDGFGNTGELTLNFTFNDTSVAHVTAQGIPVGSRDGIVTSITYKTNMQTSGVPANLETDGHYLRTDSTHSYILMAPDGQYFTEITATISGFPAQYVGYNASAGLSPNNDAVTFGTMAGTASTGAFNAKLSISSAAVQPAVEYTYTSNVVGENKAATQMQMAAGAPLFTFNKEGTQTVQLGTKVEERTIHYNAVISTTTYPYSNNQVVDRPVIYLRLPKTITVTQEQVKLSSVQTGGDAPKETEIDSSHYTFISHEDYGGDDFHVYEIRFNENDYAGAIGCFNKQLGENQLRLEFDMLASVDTADLTLKMYETVFVGYTDGTPIKASGSLAGSQRADTFDVDGDNEKNEYFSTMTDLPANQLDIKAARIGLEFNSAAKIEGTESDYLNYKAPDSNPEGLVGNEHTMYLTEDGQTIDFQFTAENTTGSPISIDSDTLGEEDFFYYIPVPKIGDNWDAHIQRESESFGLDMVLDREVEVNEEGTTGLVQVLYSTTVVASDKSGDYHYNNAEKIGDNYKLWEQIDDPTKIRMIRISVAPLTAGQVFPNNYKATFNIHYKFALNAEELVGSAVEFGPCGITSYKRSGTDASGHTPTQRIRAELQTGRIAGRVFIDADYSGNYTSDKDYFIEFEDATDPETQHGAFLDSNKNGSKDDGEVSVTMDLHAESESGVKHYAQKPTLENNPYNNTYAIPGLRAEDYTLSIANPSYTDGEPGEYSLRFIGLAAETVSSRDNKEQAPASEYTAGYHASTTASITVNADSVTNNRMRDIALERPHKVTFTVTYDDPYAATASATPAAVAPVTAYVWHGDAATQPELALADDFQWAGDGSTPTWTTTGGNTDFGSPIISTNREITYTATAVRKSHSVIYNANDGNTDSVPANVSDVINGQSVTLNGTQTPTRAPDGDKAVVFIGWTNEANKAIVEKGAKVETAETLGCIKTITMTDEDKTVYALWGYDENNNGTADALETRYTLTYNANGGSNPPAAVGNLLAGDTETLTVTAPTAPAGGGKTVVFVGWAENPAVQGRIFGKEDISQRVTIDDYKVSSVTMLTGDKTVYAIWAYDENNNDTPDYQETLQALHYHYTGNSDSVTADKPGTLDDTSSYLPGMTVTLWTLPEGETWTGTSGGGSVAFAGWSASEPNQVYSDAPEAGVLVTAIKMDADEDVYAVWAYDRNKNGTPDYQERQITLHYDLNGGSGTDIPDQTGLVEGAAYYLRKGEGLTRSATPHDAVFAGWSLTKCEDIIPEEGTGAPAMADDPYTIPRGAAGTVTLYAVYGDDNNGNGIADYHEDAQHVAYYPNGGQHPDGTDYPPNTPFWICPHHHVAGEEAELQEPGSMPEMIRRDGAVLIGWSAAPQADILSAAPGAGILIDKALIPDTGNAMVYAVWAQDLNGNGTPDYTEPRYSQWFYYNSALKDWLPDGSDPDANTEHAPDATVNGYPEGVARIEYSSDDLPKAWGDILPGSRVEVPEPTLQTRTDYDVNGNEVHHYVQLGWSSFCHPPVASESDMRWVHGEYRTVRNSRFQYNFAVWALDDNHNGAADFREGYYTLRYDPNGGAGDLPEDQDYLPGLEVTLDTVSKPVRTRAVFLGWSWEKHDPAANRADAAAWKADSVTLPAAHAQPDTRFVTVYALWAMDENANATPDYEERHTLTFDANPVGGGIVSGMPTPLTREYAYGAEVTLPNTIPTHSDVNGRPVVFAGWSDEKTALARSGAVYHAGDTIKIGIYDLTLYAVWELKEAPAAHPKDPDEPGGTTPTPEEPGGTTQTPGEPGGTTPTPGEPGGTAPTPDEPGGTTPAPDEPGGTAPTPGAGGISGIPQTGDSAHPAVWAALFALSGVGAAGLFLTRSRRRRLASALPVQREKSAAPCDSAGR